MIYSSSGHPRDISNSDLGRSWDVPRGRVGGQGGETGYAKALPGIVAMEKFSGSHNYIPVR